MVHGSTGSSYPFTLGATLASRRYDLENKGEVLAAESNPEKLIGLDRERLLLFGARNCSADFV